MRFPLFGPTARLAKRWVSAHMFSEVLCEEAIELMVASLFLTPLPVIPPASVMCGFHRFLHLLATFDWQHSPLIVDINNDISAQTLAEIMVSCRSSYHDNLELWKLNGFLCISFLFHWYVVIVLRYSIITITFSDLPKWRLRKFMLSIQCS